MGASSRSSQATALVLAGLALMSGLGAWWAWPKSHQLDVAPGCIGHYRGFGLTDDDSFPFGKSYYLVTFPTGPLTWQVHCRRQDYGPFKASYPDGALAAEGECRIEPNGSWNQPTPDPHDILWGKFYRPDGTLGSEVKDGTGTQVLYEPDGTKVWELELQDFRRAHLTMWYPNGQLQHTCTYANGVNEGPSVSHYPSGVKRREGAYTAGRRSGRWVEYNEDGTISSVEDHTGPAGRPSAGR